MKGRRCAAHRQIPAGSIGEFKAAAIELLSITGCRQMRRNGDHGVRPQAMRMLLICGEHHPDSGAVSSSQKYVQRSDGIEVIQPPAQIDRNVSAIDPHRPQKGQVIVEALNHGFAQPRLHEVDDGFAQPLMVQLIAPEVGRGR